MINTNFHITQCYENPVTYIPTREQGRYLMTNLKIDYSKISFSEKYSLQYCQSRFGMQTHFLSSMYLWIATNSKQRTNRRKYNYPGYKMNYVHEVKKNFKSSLRQANCNPKSSLSCLSTCKTRRHLFHRSNLIFFSSFISIFA